MERKTALVILLPILLRYLIVPFPHSGEGNYHGSKTAYGGDYEAQRHWMEMTLHLPISQWYKYDLSYWGLDYPPLIAYGSYLMGRASVILLGKESLALFASRGFEDPVHKVFMRSTVIFWDAVIYFPAMFLICKRLYGSHDKMLRHWLFAMLSPAMILVDNGHFQYNNVCLGLALGAFHFMTLRNGIGFYDAIGSMIFCLALNWKQMGLYYAPAVFAFLLGKCFNNNFSITNTNTILGVLKNIALLWSSVITTFFILWYPFYHFREDETEGLVDVYGPILRRIFPFSRGLFEGKVSNIWCALNIRPLSIRSRIPEQYQPICALVLTIVMMLPFCMLLFAMGRKKNAPIDNLKALLWGSAGTSISFFLASFQVHEKSILLPLAPLIVLEAPALFIEWISIMSTWSLWPLLVVDRLQVVYCAVNTLFMSFLWATHEPIFWAPQKSVSIFGVETRRIFSGLQYTLQMLVLPSSIIAMLGLHFAELFVAAPQHLPDLFPVLWILVGCASFSVMWIVSLCFLNSFLVHSNVKTD
jgi:alpha-1,3-glucosyltransferase